MLQSTVAPALPVIQDELDATSSATAWVFTGYLLSASVLTPIVGRLGDMFGKARTLVIVLAVLSLGVLLAALATSIEMLIFARIVQGTGGALFPLAFGIIRDEFPAQRSAQGIAMISSILGIGGGLGIVLSGPIIENLDYHWLFWFPLVATVAATVAAIFFVPESPIRSPGRVDWAGGALLSTWLVLILLGISRASDWGWVDARSLSLIGAGLVLMAFWVRFENRVREPLVDMTMMRIRGVWTVNAAAFLIGAGMYSAFLLIPEFTETPVSAGYGFGASVTEAGLFLLPMTVAMILVSPIAGSLATRIGPRATLIAGSLTVAAAFTLMAAAHDTHLTMYLATTLMGIGIALAFSSLANLIVEVVPPSQTGVATGMNTVMRTLGGSVGGQISASLIAGTVVAANLPTEEGFTLAFGFAAGACLLAAVASFAVPRPLRLRSRSAYST